jgi:hypothetical protein
MAKISCIAKKLFLGDTNTIQMSCGLEDPSEVFRPHKTSCGLEDPSVRPHKPTPNTVG